MKIFLLTSALVVFAMGNVFGKDKPVNSKDKVEASPCSITTTKYCKGSGTMISNTSTSSVGNCDNAYTASSQGWKDKCLGATVKKIIMELQEEAILP